MWEYLKWHRDESKEGFELFSCLVDFGHISISYEMVSVSLHATFNPIHNLYSYPRTLPLSGPDLSPPPSLTGLLGLRKKELKTVARFHSHKIGTKRSNNIAGNLNVRWTKIYHDCCYRSLEAYLFLKTSHIYVDGQEKT